LEGPFPDDQIQLIFFFNLFIHITHNVYLKKNKTKTKNKKQISLNFKLVLSFFFFLIFAIFFWTRVYLP